MLCLHKIIHFLNNTRYKIIAFNKIKCFLVNINLFLLKDSSMCYILLIEGNVRTEVKEWQVRKM